MYWIEVIIHLMHPEIFSQNFQCVKLFLIFAEIKNSKKRRTPAYVTEVTWGSDWKPKGLEIINWFISFLLTRSVAYRWPIPRRSKMKTNRPPVSFSSNFMKRITYSFTVILCSFLFFSLSGTYTFTSNMHSHMCQTVNKKLFVIQSFPLWSSVDSDT